MPSAKVKLTTNTGLNTVGSAAAGAAATALISGDLQTGIGAAIVAVVSLVVYEKFG